MSTFKTVYRVHHKDDRKLGPYRRWIKDKATRAQYKRLLSRPLLISNLGYIPANLYFGFPNSKALRKWFTKRDLVSLRMAGYVIGKYKVPIDQLVLDVHGTQCAFPINSVELLEAA